MIPNSVKHATDALIKFMTNGMIITKNTIDVKTHFKTRSDFGKPCL